MKKTALIMIALGLTLSAASAHAGNNGVLQSNPAAGQENKKVRKADPSSNAKGFWAREAERSGFAGTAQMIGKGLGNATPFGAANSGKKKTE